MQRLLLISMISLSFGLNGQDTLRFNYTPDQLKFSKEMHQFIDTIFESFTIQDYDSIVIQSYVNDSEKSGIQYYKAKLRLRDCYLNTAKQSYIELLTIRYKRYPILIESKDVDYIDLIFY